MRSWIVLGRGGVGNEASEMLNNHPFKCPRCSGVTIRNGVTVDIVDEMLAPILDVFWGLDYLQQYPILWSV